MPGSTNTFVWFFVSTLNVSDNKRLKKKKDIHKIVILRTVVSNVKGKGKVIPLQVRCDPEGG